MYVYTYLCPDQITTFLRLSRVSKSKTHDLHNPQVYSNALQPLYPRAFSLAFHKVGGIGESLLGLREGGTGAGILALITLISPNNPNIP